MSSNNNSNSGNNASGPSANKLPPASISLTLQTMGHLKPARVFQKSVDDPTPQGPGYVPRHITGISFDDHGDTLITAAEDETFRLYNCKTGKHVKTLYSKKYGITLPRFTHKNTNIIHASTKEDDTIRYHSLHDNKYLQYFKGHKKKVVSLEMSPIDDGFMSGSEDNTVRLWDLRTPNCRGMLNLPATPIVAYDSQGLVFAVALNVYQRILLYDTKNFDKEPFLAIHLDDISLGRLSFPPRIPVMTSLSFSTNGKYLLVGTAGDGHYVLDAFEGGLLVKLDGFEGLESGKSGNSKGVVPSRGISGEEVSWTPDSKFVLGGSHNGLIHIWDLESNPPDPNNVPPVGQVCDSIKPTFNLEGHSGPSRCVKFNPRYAMMASAGAELAFWLPETAPNNNNDGDIKMHHYEDSKGKGVPSNAMDWSS